MKGISFSPEMVEAIMAGRKTQTRRLAKGEKPPFKEGDTLYVREATQITGIGDHYEVQVKYRDDYEQKVPVTPDSLQKIRRRKNPHRWLAPRYMLADFSRTLIRVESIRREKLQDITEGDAIEEGIASKDGMFLDYLSGGYSFRSPISSFISLWRKVHPKQRGWDTDVWVITFSI